MALSLKKIEKPKAAILQKTPEKKQIQFARRDIKLNAGENARDKVQLIPYHMPNGKTESIPKNHVVFNDKGEVVDLTPEGKAKLEMKIEAANANSSPSPLENTPELKPFVFKRGKKIKNTDEQAENTGKIKFKVPRQMSAKDIALAKQAEHANKARRPGLAS